MSLKNSQIRQYLIIAVVFTVTRIAVVNMYHGNYFYYGMVVNQFSIASAAMDGHWNSRDEQLDVAVSKEASLKQRFIPIEDWKNFPRSGVYKTFPASDLPGYGYIIAFTSKLSGGELTSRYAFAIQLLAELLSLLFMAYCAGLVLGKTAPILFGLIYVLLYPFIWPVVSQPMRDIFALPIYAFFILSFFIFSRGGGWRRHMLILSLFVLLSLLLWVRPLGYYFVFLSAPAVLFLKHKKNSHRLAFMLVSVLVPVLIFGLPFRQFNIRHYGVSDTKVLGRGVWEGMGIVGENKYGFKLDDQALIPWIKSKGHRNVEYGSPEMNRILGEYAFGVIRRDPGFYLKTVLVRTKSMLRSPFPFMVFPRSVGIRESGLSLKQYAAEHPADAVKTVLGVIAGLWGNAFFVIGIAGAFIMLLKVPGRRAEVAVFVLPVFHMLATLLPINYEPRYFVVAAPFLILPLMWAAHSLNPASRRTDEPTGAEGGNH